MDLSKTEGQSAVHTGQTPKKGRPTPSRREQEAARRKPLVPVDRKAAKKQAREDAKLARLEQREAFARGDQKALPTRDRGPIKAFIRDWVDARRNFGEILLPLMLIVLVLTILPSLVLKQAGFFLVWAVVVIGAIDCFRMVRKVRQQIRERFDTEPPKGTNSYAVMRAFQMRMSRRPMPRVKRGDTV